VSSPLHVFAASLLEPYRCAQAPVRVGLTNDGAVETKYVCSKGSRRNAYLCVRSREGSVVILPDIRYSTWSQEVRGTAVSARSTSTMEDMTAFVAWRNVLDGTRPTLMCIKNGSVVATDDPGLQDSDPFAVVVEETEQMTLQVVDVRVGEHSFPFLLRNDKDKNLREQILEQCDWRVRTLLSKLQTWPSIVGECLQAPGLSPDFSWVMNVPDGW
jgi:hypothetical protein